MKTVNAHFFIEIDGNKKCNYCGLMLIHKTDNPQMSFSFMNKVYYPQFDNGKPVTTKAFDNCGG